MPIFRAREIKEKEFLPLLLPKRTSKNSMTSLSQLILILTMFARTTMKNIESPSAVRASIQI